ncbi:MAG: 16S rRNA (guanine(966)-N(2))-methyltransferase RsmD [Candidatus Omnitrophota bacterium]|nr:16S rRNA (guanine(966)-N(2))-methyltransferase RsmD [Candidatus Omnitrophota bacterium]
MRIIGGEYRSRLISMPRGIDIRPTQDKVREAIFNLIGDVNGKSVLELFAGSGAFGIEAISRGARYAAFVDNNFKCAETIKTNLESLGVAESKYEIIRANASSLLPRLEKEAEKPDIIFLDPPYHKGIARKCLINIDSYDILSPIGFVIVEHFKKDNIAVDLKSLILEKERRYADTVISIFRKVIIKEGLL